MSTVLNFIAKRGIRSAYSSGTYVKGQDYFKTHRVHDLLMTHPSNQESIIGAMVKGTKSYQVTIRLQDKQQNVYIDGSCSCPMRRECKHIVATLLQAIDQTSSGNATPKNEFQPISMVGKTKPAVAIDPAVTQWLSQLSVAMTKKEKPETLVDKTYGLYYILSRLPNQSMQLKVDLSLVRHLKAGGFGAVKSFSKTASATHKHLYPIDKDLLIKLEIVNK